MDRKKRPETQGQNAIVIKASYCIHGTRVTRRLTKVARSITREKRLRQSLDPASFGPAPLHLDAVLERINGTRIRLLIDQHEMRIAGRIGKSGLNCPGGSKRNE